jgi:sialic acid synthase SpsE
VPTGYSDHTLSTTIAGLAVAAGACLLEKHLTLDRARAGPDHAMSLDPPQFAAYVTAARAAHAALGSGVLGLSPLEHDVRVAARKSVVAARAIRAGAIVSADMLTIKRPGGGVPPDELDGLIGRQAACDIAADAVIAWSMLS